MEVITPTEGDPVTTVGCDSAEFCIKDIPFPESKVQFIVNVCYLCIGTIGIAGNIFVITVMLYFKHLRKSVTNMLIIHQSIIDTIASVLIIMAVYLKDIPVPSSHLGMDIYCRIILSNLFLWTALTASTYNVVTMTLERYVAIVYPWKQNLKITHKRAYIMMFMSWFSPFVYIFLIDVTTSKVSDSGMCLVGTGWPSKLLAQFGGAFLAFSEFIIPVSINAVVNTHIALVLRKKAGSQNAMTASENRRKKITKAQNNVLKTLVFVFIMNVVCFVWSQAYLLLFTFGYVNSLDTNFFRFSIVAVFLNSSVNPFIYIVQYEHFQNAVKQLLKCKKNSSSGLSYQTSSAGAQEKKSSAPVKACATDKDPGTGRDNHAFGQDEGISSSTK